MNNAELAEVFAALVALRRGERPGAVLEGLVGDLETFEGVLENETVRHLWRETGRENDAEKITAR